MNLGKRKAPDARNDVKARGEGAGSGSVAAVTPNQRRRDISAGMSDSYYHTLYKTEPDFRQLAKLDDAFASVFVCGLGGQ